MQHLLVSLFGLAATARPPSGHRQGQTCRCFPGDACWPSPRDWADFNKTMGGRLVATTPLAAPCHDSNFAAYNNETCTGLQAGWLEPQTHYDDSASIMAPYFANRSCDPFTSRDIECVLGTYAQYAINVSCTADVVAGIKFATKRNIRLVIRNTGHDYNGKSTGSGSLAIWTHHLKDISISDYSSKYYTGKAIKLGAGVQGFEAYNAADAQGLQVVGGECPTVGIAGGYTQGGGHSALASKHGLAADQVLEWEVVTGTGQYLIANRNKNSDLYWALSGGGGGTYGIVISMTSKAHPDSPTSAMNLTFTSAGVSQDDYYSAISTFHASLPALVDAGAMSVWYFTNESFAISPITAPDIFVDDLRKYLAPLENKLTALNITYASYYGQFSGYLKEYNAMQGPIDVGIAQYGGRLIPGSVVEQKNEELTNAYRFINNNGGQFIGVGVNVSRKVTGDVYNAVNPGWRTALIDTVITTPWNFTAPWSDMQANQDKMTNILLPALEALTPNGTCYLNEGDFRQPDWQDVFYGANYAKLNAIKDKYDPQHVFWAVTAVGSEYWEPVNETGRLCRAGYRRGKAEW